MRIYKECVIAKYIIRMSLQRIERAMILVCEPKNASLQALSLGVCRYMTTIEGTYNIQTYNIGIL